ncbi:MAG: D-alanyl-D-alanine carboxypeptidase [Oscillospiraceae bacterium]|nr:D-alanyl-D-alanine carboxypeptidase [Oscillospiraceae bacterium]
MKKIRCLSIFLCAVTLLQCLMLPALATETTDAALPTQSAAYVDDPVPTVTEPEFGQVCVQNGCRTINGMIPLAGSDRRLETALSAFLYEVNTGTVVYSYNPDSKVGSGTLSKIVNAMVVLQHCDDLQEVVTVKNNRFSGGNQHASIKIGEELTVEQLLYSMILISANDAAVALAEHVAGTQQAFVGLMNQWAAQAGCTGTEFNNVYGTDSASNITTARDMAKIVNAAIKDEEFVEIWSAVEYTIGETNKQAARKKYNTQNYMMDQAIIPDFYDNRVKGGIPSATDASGASLVCVAESGEGSKQMRYIAVVMGCTRTYAENGWSVKSYGNFNEMSDLLSYAFDNFKVNRILYEGMSLSQFRVNNGESYAVGQSFVDIDSVVPINAQMDNLQMNFKVVDGGLAAPIKKDQLIATMEVVYRNSVMAEAEVFSMGDVKPADKTGVTIRSTAVRSDTDDSGILSVIGTICVIVLGLAVGYLAFNAYMRSRMRARRRKRRADRRRNRG